MKPICVFALFLGVTVPGAFAAVAKCQAGWEWAFNSKQQTPCQMASTLEAACQGQSTFQLAPLPTQGANYTSPGNATSRTCDCNTVIYSLYMACTACQGVYTGTWTYWSQNCTSTDISVSQYPGTISPDSPIPNWAYLDYTYLDRFDPVAAKAAGDYPERTGRGLLVQSSSTPTPTSSSSLSAGGSLATGTPTGLSQQNRPSPTVTAVMGGVIGVLVCVVVVGAATWYFRRAHKAPKNSVNKDGASAPKHGVRPPSLRTYDPSDPETFPGKEYIGPSNNGRFAGTAEL